VKTLKGRGVTEGKSAGPALVTKQMFGFWGGVDPATGTIIDQRHELYGQSVKGKVFVFPEGRGSTVGAAIILELVRCGNAPAAIINRRTEVIIASGGILADKFYNAVLPIVDDLDADPISEIKTGDWVEVDGTTGIVIVGASKSEVKYQDGDSYVEKL
jgi:predicted aconitase with swiveling domain